MLFLCDGGKLAGMKLQFSLATLLLATAVTAIGYTGILCWLKLVQRSGARWFLAAIAFQTPVWLPFAFVAFILGRKSLTLSMVIVFAIAEAACIGLSYALGPMY